MAEPNPKELFDLGLESIRLGNVSGKVEDFIRGRKYIEKAYELNDGRGCDLLGSFYESGGGTIKKDLKKAIQYHVKACELNEMFGCLSLVSNSQINKQKLFQYLSKACGLNSGNGCRFLGDFYENGKYVKKDLRKAAQYYSKACGLNDQDGCLILGYKQYTGKGVVKNEKQAVKTFEKACKLGSEKACELFDSK
ncbi:sel1 repeat family protein [Helicobacter pylori]|nr:sel1 repeat family protein [Helicobacter pylori]